MASNSDFETLISTWDVELLKRAGRQRQRFFSTKELLSKRAEEQIELVEETIEDYVGNGIDPLVVSLDQMDLDRRQFLLKMC